MNIEEAIRQHFAREAMKHQDPFAMKPEVHADAHLSRADESLLEMFVNLLDSPAILQVAKAFRESYGGPLKTLMARLPQERRGDAKAVARALNWRSLLVVLYERELEAALTARSLDGVLAVSAEVKENLGSLVPETQPGLMMLEFHCPNRDNLPDFASMEPTRKSMVKQVSYAPGTPRIDRDAALFRGFLEIRRAGNYKLWTESLDGSRLWLDGRLVVDNDGRRMQFMGPPNAQEREGSANLQEGLHELRLEWFAHHHWEHHHAAQLIFRYSGPDSNDGKVVVPESALRHAEEDHGKADEPILKRTRQFLCEIFATCNDQHAILLALPLYSPCLDLLFEQAPQQLRARLAVEIFNCPSSFEERGWKIRQASVHSEAVNEAFMHSFVEAAHESMQTSSDLARPLETLKMLYRGPASSIVWFLCHRWRLEDARARWQGMREAAKDIEWEELANALMLVDPPSGFRTRGTPDISEEVRRACPLLVSLAPLDEDYAGSGMVDMSSFDIKDEAALCEMLLPFPTATRLFLPPGSVALADRAKRLLPSLQVAHLGCLLSVAEMAELESEYASSKELWVPTSLTMPAFLELIKLCPEPKLVALAGPSGPQAAAQLDDPGNAESPVFEMGTSVSEFTGVFEFYLHGHQVPGEVYHVCVGQFGFGHGDFCLAWSRHWADGRDSIILKHEGNQGGGGRIMHGGHTCGFDMSGALKDGEWHRVAVVYDANSRTCTLHVDGWERSETQTWNHCNPLRLDKVTIGEQGAGAREGRRPDRQFPVGQLRNVKLYDHALPKDVLFCADGRASLKTQEVQELRRQYPGVPLHVQSVVPLPMLRNMLKRYQEDRTVNVAECQDLTKEGLTALMSFFPEVEKIFLPACGCTQELNILPPESCHKYCWSSRSSWHKKRKNTHLEWKDLAAIFLTRKLAKVVHESSQPDCSGTAALDEIMRVSMQLSSLGAEATDEVDKERLGLFLVEHAFSDLGKVQLGLLDVAAFHHENGRSYLSALAPHPRAALARLILTSEDGLGMQPKRSSTKRLPQCTPADTALLEAFVALLGDSSEASMLKQQLRHFRALFRGPLQDLVDVFTAATDSDKWAVVRDVAREIQWNELTEAFSLALLRPRTLKMKVRKQQCVTDEVVQAYQALQDHASPCAVCAGEAEYRLSTECSHYFCGACISRSLQAIKDAGQFPGYCPGCRAESALKGLGEPPVGRVQTPALAVLEGRGIITWDFQLQFLRQHTKDPEEYFRCPGKCGEYLHACSPQYMSVAKGEHEHEGFRRMMRLGECRCGATMCVQCRQLVATDHRGRHEHTCAVEKAVEDPHEKESVNAMERLGKRCPNCGIFLEMNGGCDIMMCGTEAHGRLEKALANGGCGYQFHWETGEPAHSFYIGLNGERVEGIVGRRG